MWYVAGLIASSSMIIYWLYSLKTLMVGKGWKYTSHFWVLPWITFFLGSLSGLLRISGIIESGSVIDAVLLHAYPILTCVAFSALVAAMLLDATAKARRAREY